MAAVTATAVAGVADQFLCHVDKDMKDKHMPFKNAFRNLKSTLDAIKPLISEKAQHNLYDQHQEEELQKFKLQMEEGTRLVNKCSQFQLWNFFKRYKYNKELIALNKSLERILDTLRVQVGSDVMKSLYSANIESMIMGIETWCEVPKIPRVTVGLDEPLRELKLKLLRDDKVSMLMLTAPGGCGKTTLAAMFCHDQEVRDYFKDNIFFVNVSKEPNLGFIIQQLYGRKGSPIPTFQDEEASIMWLHQFLKVEGQEKPLLLVLDDVWFGSESLIEKFYYFRRPNYKILVTSRSEFPRFSCSYHLQLLNNEDAMTLFREESSGGGSSNIPEELERKIVESCKGFRIAIVLVGSSLAGQPVEVWKKQEMKWSKGNSTLDSETAVLENLRRSLDDFGGGNAIIKDLFLDLASFPEGKRIAAVGLIDMWAELYEIDRDYFSIASLYELNARGLANLVVRRRAESFDYYTEYFVTQHGMLRDLAIHEARQDPIGQTKRLIIDICGHDPPKWWTEQKDKPKKTRLLSISTDEMFTKWPIMQLPKPEVLIINFQTENYALPKFLKNMYKSLKVLIVTNYGSSTADLSNFNLLGSLSNMKRIRLEGILFPSITTKMTSLQKMSLFMCNISQAFRKGTIRLSDAWPNLEEMNIDYCRDLIEFSEDLCDLIQLKKLSITNCHNLASLPKLIGNLVNLEVLRLRSCTDLEILPASIGSLNKLELLDISCCFSIKELPEHFGEMSNLRKLNIRECSRLQEMPVSVLDLTQLKEVVCDDQTEHMLEPFLPYLVNVSIRVVKEEINLKWLHASPF